MSAHTRVGVWLYLLGGNVKEAGSWTYFLILSAMPTSTDRGRTVLIFSKLGGETTEKHTKKTSVWGYDNGRSRLFNQLCQGIKGILQSDHPIRCLIARREGRSKDLHRLTRNPPDLLYPTDLDLWVFHRQAPKPSNCQIQSVHIYQISSYTSLQESIRDASLRSQTDVKDIDLLAWKGIRGI